MGSRGRLRLRFKVLQAAGFRCFYCGRGRPEVVLELEHVTPLSQGGGWDLENLRAACRDCNLGKGAHPVPVALTCQHPAPWRMEGGELLCCRCDALVTAVPAGVTA